MKNSMDTRNGIVTPSIVPNTAAIDTFTAPDSTARRPNPESVEDRPFRGPQTYNTTLEADLPTDE